MGRPSSARCSTVRSATQASARHPEGSGSMPEGDNVYRAAQHLDGALAGKPVTRSDFRVPAFATVDLAGETVHSVGSRGKHLLMRIGDQVVHSHLKMEGEWHVYR